MSSLQDLLAQKADIDRQISEARRHERNEAISKVRALMDLLGQEIKRGV